MKDTDKPDSPHGPSSRRTPQQAWRRRRSCRTSTFRLLYLPGPCDGEFE